MAVKLVPAAAVVVTALIANNFQAAMSTSNLLSQREQADSTLRANMFQGLISPILGSKQDNSIPIDREQLMVELLALNFHENFELKPIMLHVDNRLVQEHYSNKVNSTGETPRESLRSIANRVLQRQLAAITKVENDSPPGEQACIYRLNLSVKLKSPANGAKENTTTQHCSTIEKTFNELTEIRSPNGAYNLYLQIKLPNGKRLEDHVFQVEMLIKGDKSKQVSAKSKEDSADFNEVSAKSSFLLTHYDFPFTDNTLLADGTRFALVIDSVNAKSGEASFKLVWFPQDYFSARERPINYREFREKLGIKLN